MNLTRTTAILLAAACAALPAAAWGPKTQVAIVLGSMRVLSREANVPLSKLTAEVQAGASISDEEMLAYIPNADISPIPAIETQIVLLQSVRGQTLDPYFAFRLGVLGKLVAKQTAPLREGDVTARSQYYTDVEANVDRTAIKAQPRRSFEPRSYLTGVVAAANAQNELIEADYKTGVGFQGLAAATLPADVSRSVQAVTDIWYAILSGSAGAAARSQLLDYALNGLQFAVSRERGPEIDRAYERVMEITRPDGDLRVRIGNLFYDAGLLDRAVIEYEAVLNIDPARRDIGGRIAAYYYGKGEQALETEALEDARDAFRLALQFDETHPDAQNKYNEAQDLIRARDERMAESQEALAQANALRANAGDAEVNGNAAEAITLLFQAQMLYASVTTEFPQLANEARIGGSAVSIKINELKLRLVQDAASLSGAGASALAMKSAAETAAAKDRELLQQLGEAATSAAVDAVTAEVAAEYIGQ